MARVPTMAEEDAKRPNRERECLAGERTRIVNRIKATLARLGIRNFKPTLRKAAEMKVLCSGQVPALIAKFDSTGTPVPSQCHPEVVRPDGHAELPG
jgi:transposase